MDKIQIFNDCVEESIRLGRKYMSTSYKDNIPTKEEWHLALILFQNELQNEKEI